MKTRILLIAVCVGMLAAAVTAAPPLARRVPSGTLVYIGWAGTTGQAFERSTFGQLLKEPAFGKIIGAVKKLALDDARGKKGRDIFEHVWSLAGIVARRPIAIAWTGIHETPREPIPTGAVLIDLGNDKKAFALHLDALVDKATEDDVPIRKDTVGGVTYWKTQERGGPEVAFGYVGNLFFLTLGPGMARDVITLDPGKSLAANKAFAARMKEVGGDNEQLSLYVDVIGIRKVVEPLIKAEMGPGKGPTPEQVFKALGLAGVRAVAGSTRIVQTGMTTRTKVFSPAPHRGLMMLFGGKPLTKADMSHVPADADFAAAANVSPSRVWKEIRAGVRSIDPKAEQEMLQGLAQPEKAIGLSFEKDLLGNMGDTWVISSAASQGGFLTGTVITAELKDARAFGAAAGKIEAFFQAMLANEKAHAERPRPMPSIETVKVGHTEIRYVALPMGPVPVAPAWAIHKNRLYIAGFPQVIQAAIENEGKNPLSADADFAACRAKVDKNASMISYVNTPKIINKVYNLILVIWTLGANSASGETPFAMKPDWLPAMSKLVKYLSPSISAVSSDKTGIIFERHGSMPFGGLAGPMLMPMFMYTTARKTAVEPADISVELGAPEETAPAPVPGDPARPPRRPVMKDGDF